MNTKYSSTSDVESDLRQAEIVYHQKVDSLVLMIGLAIYLFFSVFDFMTARYFQSLIFVLLTVNGLAALAIAKRTKDPDKLVLLKRIFGGAAFLLLAMLIFTGFSGGDFYLFLPWIFSFPVSVAVMFGKRIGICSVVAYTVIFLLLIPFVDIPEWSTGTGSLIKWNAAFALIVITGILMAAERSRRLEQRELVTARYEHKASENRQREINVELEHEISLRIQSEEKRKRMDRQLQQAGRMQAVATLAGGIAHQFNNALTGISGNLELIGLDENVAAAHADRMETLHRLSNRMIGLTDRLLAYARGGKYRPRTFSVNDLIRDLLDADRIGVAESIELKQRFDSTVCEIRGDTTQIEMVIEAVLANAVESIKGNGMLSIATRNLIAGESETGADMPPGQYAVIEIQDNGEGMDAETCDRIFEPFFTTKFFGRGLGMAAAYGIIQNHGGRITVSSELHKGTRVTIQLPANEKSMNATRSSA